MPERETKAQIYPGFNWGISQARSIIVIAPYAQKRPRSRFAINMFYFADDVNIVSASNLAGNGHAQMIGWAEECDMPPNESITQLLTVLCQDCSKWAKIIRL